MHNKKLENDILIILGGLLLVLILIFVVFGDKIYNLFRITGGTEEERRKALEKEFEELSEKINKNVLLKAKLDKKFSRTYLFFRIGLFLISVAITAVFYFIFCSSDSLYEFIDKMVNLYEFILLWLGFSLYVSYGNFNGFKEFIESWKKWIHVRVYKNNLNIEEKIQVDIERRDKLENELKQFPKT